MAALRAQNVESLAKSATESARGFKDSRRYPPYPELVKSYLAKGTTLFLGYDLLANALVRRGLAIRPV